MLQGNWERIGGVAPAIDSPLFRPLLLAGHGDRVYVFDYGDHAVKAFDLTGTHLWSLGRRGKGPREFTNPTDLQVDMRGDLWVLDPENARITIVSREGRVRDQIAIRRPVQRLIPLDRNSFWAIGMTNAMAELLNAEGATVRSVRQPELLSDAAVAVRETRVSVTPDGRYGLIGFIYADPLLLLDLSSGALRTIRGIEPQPFPKMVQWSDRGAVFTRVDPEARPATLSITSDQEHMYVLYGGTSPHRGRIVDRYLLSDGTYRGSFILPQRVLRIVRVDRGFAALVSDPVPAIHVWRWLPQ
jgi:hypothetical protein